VLLNARRTSLAVSVTVLAGAALCTNTDPVANLDISFGLGTNTDGCSNDFMADAARVVGGALDASRVSDKGSILRPKS